MPQETPSQIEDRLRRVRYERHEFHGDPEALENSLLAFVYDIPYFGACGVFPPFHLLNLEFRGGGAEGGMGPGATWEPFELSRDEYRDLVEAVRTVPVESLRNRVRYAHLAFTFDPDFDGPPETYPARAEPEEWDKHIPAHYKPHLEWLTAVCAKHRARWHAELIRAGFMT